MTMTNMPLSAILFTAYELQDAFQVDGLPDWVQKESFDIEARAPAGVPISFPGQGTALPRMLQAMLADRMKLATHVEKRTVPMFALVLVRADGTFGPNLSRSSIDCTTAPVGPPVAAPQASGEGCAHHVDRRSTTSVSPTHPSCRSRSARSHRRNGCCPRVGRGTSRCASSQMPQPLPE